MAWKVELSEQADRQLHLADLDVDRHLPAALTLVFPAQDKHGETVKCERPNDAECVRFTQRDDIAAAGNDGEHLQDED